MQTLKSTLLILLFSLSLEGYSQCNGDSNLCNKRFDEVAYLTTHNSFNAKAEGFSFPNQNLGLTQQLNNGVRALMIDVYDRSGIPSVYHGLGFLGNQPLSRNLSEVKLFLDNNPNEIITLILECYVSADIIETELNNAGLTPYLYSKSNAYWDILQDMINNNTRLVIITDQNDANQNQDWYHYAWEHCVETHYSANNQNDFNNDFNRGDSINDLFIFNHFVTHSILGIGQANRASIINEFSFLMSRIKYNFFDKGKFPNFITLDFFELGDGMAVVDSLNSPTFDNEIKLSFGFNIQVTPNPASNFTIIKGLDTGKNHLISILTISGVELTAFKSKFKAEVMIETVKLSAGIYTIQIADNSGKIRNEWLIIN